MPLNPMTGQVDYGGASYDPQNLNATMGMRAAARADVQTPFVFDLLESLPSVTTSALFNARRYVGTLEKGGFFDVGSRTTGRQLRRAQRYGSMVGGQPAATTAQQFIGGRSGGLISRYAQRRVRQGKTPQLLSARANNITTNPRAVGRFSSLRALAGDTTKGYTPFQAIPSAINSLASKSARFRGRFLGSDFDPATSRAYSGGVLGRISSMQKVNSLNSRILKFEKDFASATGGAVRRVGSKEGAQTLGRFRQARYTKALQTRQAIATNAVRVANITNPIPTAASLARQSPRFAGSTMMTASERMAIARNARAGMVAGRTQAAFSSTSRFIGNEMTSGVLSNRITSFVGGALNMADASASQISALRRVAARTGGVSAGRNAVSAFSMGGQYVGGFATEVRGGFKMMGMATKYMKSGGSRAAGLKVASMGAVKAASPFLMPLNVLATGQLIYDIGKGVGKIASSGVNFAKDALKSMQGTINKPMFGTGFKDNEVAATSRARGVMAIQNSRLNARSLLGSEAAMLAAHFG
jgi:hypothetical protein